MLIKEFIDDVVADNLHSPYPWEIEDFVKCVKWNVMNIEEKPFIKPENFYPRKICFHRELWDFDRWCTAFYYNMHRPLFHKGFRLMGQTWNPSGYSDLSIIKGKHSEELEIQSIAEVGATYLRKCYEFFTHASDDFNAKLFIFPFPDYNGKKIQHYPNHYYIITRGEGVKRFKKWREIRLLKSLKNKNPLFKLHGDLNEP